MNTPLFSLISTDIQREFLGWEQPALAEAARRLALRYRQGATLDLSRVIVVIPGQRAGRRLLELLAFLAEDQKLRLTPPTVVTEGLLPEKLYPPRYPFASDVVQDLVWAQALREQPLETRRDVIPQPPAPGESLRWLELARVFRQLHRELAADGLNFAAVPERAAPLPHFNEARRWAALTDLQQRYHRLLDALLLWDLQSARLVAIQKREIETDADIILLGTVDLNDSLRQMLDQIAERVTAYIVAPPEWADRFDDHGCLVPGAWSEALVPLRDDQVRQVDGAAEQASAASAWLGELGGRYRTDEVAIGVPDEGLVPQLQRELEQCEVRARWVEGVRLGETAPFRLLRAAVEFTGRRRYEDLAALVRHPDVADWLGRVSPATPQDHGSHRTKSLPAQLDRFYNSCLPSRVHSGPWLDNSKDWPEVRVAVERIERWLANTEGEQPLRIWAGTFRALFDTIYGDRVLNLDQPADDQLHRVLRKLLAACDKLAEVPAALDGATFAAADAFHLGFGALADEFLPPPADPAAVEILGWLELPLDDSPALLVTSFNEGFVPKSAGADPFLPERLRRELNLLHNERRYARDAYAASVLCHSRQELRLLFARRNPKNEPLHPSRLLFTCSDDIFVARARQFFAERPAATTPRRLLLAADATIPAESRFDVPRPTGLDPSPVKMRVTDFKVYLACPYRYYLRHVRRLHSIDDAARELDGRAFGTLLHRVLGAFGRGPTDLRDSDREQAIFALLCEQLAFEAETLYGAARRRPALRLQLEQARRRLSAFAARQAELAREGWRILHVEPEKGGDIVADFGANGAAMQLVGRIDRIDFHEQRQALRIIDYKTADSPKTPEQTHRRQDEWTDLQLPLYRHLWPKLNLRGVQPSALELGYFNLPKQLGKASVVLADWDDDVLASADEKAREVIQSLRGAEPYWPPVYDPMPEFAEDLACICLDNVRRRPGLDADADEGDSA